MRCSAGAMARDVAGDSRRERHEACSMAGQRLGSLVDTHVPLVVNVRTASARIFEARSACFGDLYEVQILRAVCGIVGCHV